MATIIQMPKLSDTMEEGGIAKWLKKEGETISEGEILVEIETDKATMEYASPEGGVLLKILAQPGASYALQTPIAIVGARGEKIENIPTKPADLKAHEVVASSGPKAAAVASVPADKSLSLEDPLRVKASPLAKKIAQQKGLDLSTLHGSGPHGRIIAQDLEALSFPKLSPESALTAFSVSSEQDQKLNISLMRKTIAKRLVSGKNDAPHFYLTLSVNMEPVLAWRKALNDGLKGPEVAQQKVSVNDVLLLCTSRALKQHPTVNSSWQGDYILQHGSVHLAFAVALPTGLITPTLFHADKMGLKEISRKSKELVERAKQGSLKPEEYSSGTFTISNLGMTKVEDFTAIINPPQACILALGSTQTVPHVGKDRQLIAQDRMKMTLSCDHRVVDGMVGARFLETLAGFIENPLNLLN